MKKALIIGITGQDGSYLAELLLEKGYDVHGMIRRASTFNTARIEHLYQDPHATGSRLHLHYGDLSDTGIIRKLIYKIQPDEIYNLAAQSHVRVSFDIPEYTADTTALGTLRILEGIKDFEEHMGKKIKYYQASSSEMFGSAPPPQNEQTPFHPRSPYAVAKVFAYHATVNYREAHNIFAVNGILFNHECITAQMPVIIRKHGFIETVAIEELVPHRENPKHGIKYSTVASGETEIWDGNKFTTIKTLTATWNKAGSAGDKKVKRVISRGGCYEATSDHLSFLNTGKTVKTRSLKKGQLLKLQTLPDLTKLITMSKEEAEFLGMMVGDGYISQDGKGRFINNDQKLRARATQLWRELTGGYSRETTHPSGFNKNRSVHSVEFAGRPDYARYIWNEIYNQKLFKKVPLRILNAKKEIAVCFLKGYNACDGLKKGNQKTEFKSFTTNSAVLALGLWYLVSKTLELRITLHPESRNEKLYFHLNINSGDRTKKGKHLQREISEVKTVQKHAYTGWLFDLETTSGTFSAGVGLTWIHNSPRRGGTFVTKKITRGIARILAGVDKKIYLGNLESRRDWGYAPEYMEAAWLMMQQPEPDDYVIGTGESHSVAEFLETAFRHAGIENWRDYVEIDPRYFRPSEVEHLLADTTKAREKLGWKPKTTFSELVKIMVDEDLKPLK